MITENSNRTGLELWGSNRGLVGVTVGRKLVGTQRGGDRVVGRVLKDRPDMVDGPLVSDTSVIHSDIPGAIPRTTGPSRALLILVSLSTLVFGGFLGLTMSTQRQVSDEWLFAAWLRERGLWGSIRYGYTHISGRVPLHLLGGTVATLPRVCSLALSLVALLAIAIAARSLIGSVGDDGRIGRRDGYLVGWMCVVAMVAGSPARNQAMFWPIGALVYLFPVTLALAALAISVRAHNQRRSAVSWLLRIFGVFCAFFASAGNENLAVIVPILLFAVAVRGVRARARSGACGIWGIDVAQWMLCGAAVLGGLTLILAPGNWQRPKLLARPLRHDPRSIVTIMGRNVEVLLANVLFSGIAPMVTLGALGFFVGRRTLDARAAWRFAGRVATAVCVLSVAVFAFVCAWGFNASAPPRSMFPVWCAVAGWAFLCGARAGSRPVKEKKRARTGAAKNGPARVAVGGLSPLVAFCTAIAPAAFAANVSDTLPRDRAVANQVDCIVWAASVAGKTKEPVSIAAPLEVDHVIILENKPTNDSNASIAKRFGSGPITRVRPGEKGVCDSEAHALLPFTRREEFGLPKTAN